MAQIIIGFFCIPVFLGLILSFSGNFKQGFIIGCALNIVFAVGVYCAIKLSSTFSKKCTDTLEPHSNKDNGIASSTKLVKDIARTNLTKEN
jgi:hypothetical protein